jgi:hypothetical protein
MNDAVRKMLEQVFTPFNEQQYLAGNPDVAAAVQAGDYNSGAQHYFRYGHDEGRPQAFDEQQYLAANPDVADAVQSGLYRSGYDHFMQHGSGERRASGARTTAFDPLGYLAANPDVDQAVGLGRLPSALDHYMRFGQFEGRAMQPAPTPQRWATPGFDDYQARARTATNHMNMMNGVYSQYDRFTGPQPRMHPQDMNSWRGNLKDPFAQPAAPAANPVLQQPQPQPQGGNPVLANGSPSQHYDGNGNLLFN